MQVEQYLTRLLNILRSELRTLGQPFGEINHPDTAKNVFGSQDSVVKAMKKATKALDSAAMRLWDKHRTFMTRKCADEVGFRSVKMKTWRHFDTALLDTGNIR